MALIYAGGLTATDFTSGVTSSGWSGSTFTYGSPVTIPSAGTVTQMAVKTFDNGGGQTFKIALYDASGNLVGSSTGTGPGNVSATWVNSGSVSLAVSSGTYYVMLSGSDNDIYWAYDASADGYYGSATFANFPEDPETLTEDTGAGDLFGVRVDFTAGGDTTPPTTTAGPTVSSVTPTTASVSQTINEAGTIYQVAVPNAQSNPSIAQVKAGQDVNGDAADWSANQAAAADTPEVFSVTGLTPNTTYKICAIAEDDETTPNVQAAVETSASFTTGFDQTLTMIPVNYRTP